MAKLKIKIEARREWDTSSKGIIYGVYSYHNPGPWVAKIVEYVEEVNKTLKEKGQPKRIIKCYISNIDGPEATVTLKGKKEDILSVANFYVSKSKILKDFAVSIK